MLNKISYPDFLDALVLFMKELDKESLKDLNEAYRLASMYEDKEKKFILKTKLYDLFWNIPKAIDDGFNVYLINKIEHYHHLSKYHFKNCEGNCDICKLRIKNYDYLFHGGIE